jgi:hypothetical protein
MDAVRIAAVVGATAALAPVSAVAASGNPLTVAPTSTQRAAIIKAFGDRPAASPCLKVQLAASNRRYATVRPKLTKACQRWAFNGTNIIKRVQGNRWKVVFEGSSYGCPRPGMPRQVQHELGICPIARTAGTGARSSS